MIAQDDGPGGVVPDAGGDAAAGPAELSDERIESLNRLQEFARELAAMVSKVVDCGVLGVADHDQVTKMLLAICKGAAQLHDDGIRLAAQVCVGGGLAHAQRIRLGPTDIDSPDRTGRVLATLVGKLAFDQQPGA